MSCSSSITRIHFLFIIQLQFLQKKFPVSVLKRQKLQAQFIFIRQVLRKTIHETHPSHPPFRQNDLFLLKKKKIDRNLRIRLERAPADKTQSPLRDVQTLA